MRTLTVGIVLAVAGLLALPVTVLVAVADEQAGGPPSPAARDDIPPAMLDLYRQAAEQRCPGLPWPLLAGVGKVESDHGRQAGARLTTAGTIAPPIIGPALDGSGPVRKVADSDGGVYDGDPELDRAVGPMQFLPATWQRVAVDASGDGQADPHQPADAIHTAAVFLCNQGGADPDRHRQALLAYNNSHTYVDDVLSHARRYRTLTADRADDAELIGAVLDNPRITIYEAGRGDIAAGEIDPRILSLLHDLSADYELAVSSLKAGHSRCVGGGDHAGCTVSNHWHGRGVDLYRIDGRRVDAGHAGARELVETLARLDEHVRPDEVGHPWPALTGPAGFFTDAAHQGHLHLGWSR